MASSSKRKGDAFEREIVALHQKDGIPARKVPLSGAVGGAYVGDVVVGPLDSGRGYHVELVGECKKRKTGAGFVQLERWLGDANVLFLRRNRAAGDGQKAPCPLVVMDWPIWSMLARQAARNQPPMAGNGQNGVGKPVVVGRQGQGIANAGLSGPRETQE
jgi:hypothetical protein